MCIRDRYYTDGKNAKDFNLSGSEKEIFESLINPDSENLRKVPDSFNPTLFKNDKSIKAEDVYKRQFFRVWIWQKET